MRSLTIDLFTSSIEDAELSEYKVLAALKNYKDLLHRNFLYPTLTELLEVLDVLNSIMNQRFYLAQPISKRITGVDIENQNLIYQTEEEDHADEIKLLKVFEFIDWAIPMIKEAINEATAIFDFVESNLEVKEIGLMPVYKKEGYFFVQDNSAHDVHIYRFQLSNIIQSEVPFKSLRTSFIDIISGGTKTKRPESIKLDLINKYHDLPNPATYNVCTDLDMPFEATILPVAKRKMIQKIAA